MNAAMKGRQPFISLRNVSLRLHGRIVFPRTNWDFFSDQHWAIVGANGSGKSMLARALRGMAPPAEGDITFHFIQNETNSFSEAGSLPRNHVAYLCFDRQKSVLKRESPIYQSRWQSSENIDTLSVLDYLSEERIKKINPHQVDRRRSAPEIFSDQREHVVSKLEIQSLMKKKIVQLSNGEMRKVMLAGALLKKPDLLILENPFTGLDQGFRNRLKTIFDGLMKGNLRILVVTSRRDEILHGITHLLVVENQKIVAKGPIASVSAGNALRKLWPSEPPPAAGLQLPRRLKPQEDASSAGVLVRMKGVNISYDGVKVLRHIDWTMKKGEHWALLGPNGSGKTTLLSLILGDNPQAYANDINLFGRRKGSGESIWDIKKRIGLVSPELHLHYPRQFSCLEVVCSGFFDSAGLYRRCTEKQRRAALSWIDQMELSTLCEERFGECSDGAQRMVLVARAMVKHPELLVLDEPCQGLDDRNRHRIVKRVEAIGQHFDTAVIFVTHDPDELPGIITHVLNLKNGGITGVTSK